MAAFGLDGASHDSRLRARIHAARKSSGTSKNRALGDSCRILGTTLQRRGRGESAETTEKSNGETLALSSRGAKRSRAKPREGSRPFDALRFLASSSE